MNPPRTAADLAQIIDQNRADIVEQYAASLRGDSAPFEPWELEEMDAVMKASGAYLIELRAAA